MPRTRQTEAKAADALIKMAHKLRAILQLPASVPIEFYSHAGDTKTPSLRE